MSSDTITVEPSDHGLSLLQFLKGRLSHSGKAIKRAIDGNGCFVNGRVERFSSSRVKSGDMVSFTIDKGRRSLCKGFPILYEDETIRAFNKTPLVSCDSSHKLHRLDKETSGVLMTSDDEVYYDLFRKRKIQKTYIAVVEGEISQPNGIINAPIGVKTRYEGHKVMHVCPEGKEAVTRYQLVSQKQGISVLILFPETGRTHQIRVHLKTLDLAILGDYDYNQSISVAAPRMLLHAYKISFIHPYINKRVTIKAPIPEDMFPYIKEEEIIAFSAP